MQFICVIIGPMRKGNAPKLIVSESVNANLNVTHNVKVITNKFCYWFKLSYYYIDSVDLMLSKFALNVLFHHTL